MEEPIAISVDSRSTKAFKKVKIDIKALKKENDSLNETLNKVKEVNTKQFNEFKKELSQCNCKEFKEKLREYNTEITRLKRDNEQLKEKYEKIYYLLKENITSKSQLKESKDNNMDKYFKEVENQENFDEENNKKRSFLKWFIKSDEELDKIKEVR